MRVGNVSGSGLQLEIDRTSTHRHIPHYRVVGEDDRGVDRQSRTGIVLGSKCCGKRRCVACVQRDFKLISDISSGHGFSSWIGFQLEKHTLLVIIVKLTAIAECLKCKLSISLIGEPSNKIETSIADLIEIPANLIASRMNFVFHVFLKIFGCSFSIVTLTLITLASAHTLASDLATP